MALTVTPTTPAGTVNVWRLPVYEKVCVIGGPLAQITICEGCVIVALPVELQPALSLTVTVYVPADKPLILDVVAPLLHKYV